MTNKVEGRTAGSDDGAHDMSGGAVPHPSVSCRADSTGISQERAEPERAPLYEDSNLVRSLAERLQTNRLLYFNVLRRLATRQSPAQMAALRLRVYMTVWTQRHAVDEETGRRVKLPPRFHLIPEAELYEQPEPGWIIEGILREDGLVEVFGAEASGKSFLALDWSKAVETGIPWHGRTVQQGIVVYIAAEGANGFPARLDAWKIASRVAPAGRLYFLTVPPELLDADAVHCLIAEMVQLPDLPKLIVVDTLARCMLGGDENDAQDMGAFVESCETLRRMTGATVLILHHQPKAGKRKTSRGSNALPGATTTIMHLERAGTSASLTLTCTKQKDAEEFQPLSLALQPKALGDGRSSCVVMASGNKPLASSATDVDEASEDEQQALDVLRRSPDGLTHGEWKTACEGAGLSKGQFNRALKSLSTKGCVTGGGHRGAKYQTAVVSPVRSESGTPDQTEQVP